MSAHLIWTQIAATDTFRAYDSGDYRIIVDTAAFTANDWVLSYRNSNLGSFGSLNDAHRAAVAHLAQVLAVAA